jgi:hypothetical protein
MQFYQCPAGQKYDLSHLRTTNYAVSLTINDKRYLVPIVVTFSHHCYTTTNKKTVLPSDRLFFRTDKTGHRAFCPTRWASSHDLPENVGYLIANNLGCYESTVGDGVYLHLRNPNQKYPGNGWYVMFNFKPAHAPALVLMGISSHHKRAVFPTNISKKARPKPFSMVLEQWLNRKPHLIKLLESGALPGTILLDP